jgi:Spermine/spermidine synthase domain
MSSTGARPPRSVVVAFGLIAMSVLLVQVVLSRLFASIMTYYYAFMLISLAMLGLASGGLLVQVMPRVFTAERFSLQAMICGAAMGMFGIVGTLALLVVYPYTNVGSWAFTPGQFWPLAGMFWCLFPFFLCGGLVVAMVFARYRTHFNLLYAVDLVFAAGGCLLAIALLEGSTPVQVLLGFCAVPMLAGALFGLAERRNAAAGVVAIAAMWAFAGLFLAQMEPIAKPQHASWLTRPTVVSEWNAVSAVRVHPGRFFTWALSPRYAGPKHDMLDLIIDGIGGTEIVRFDGNPATLKDYTYLDQDLTALTNRLLPAGANQLIVGPGGGVDILQAVRMGRSNITAVEINPLIVRVVNQELASFSGRPYNLPGVRLVLENGRTFIKRTTDKFDLISLTWVDTGGSATALAFSENYLYTVEAYREFFNHLAPEGYLAFLRALGRGEVNRTDSMRGIAVAWEALAQQGIADPARHMLVTAVDSPFFGRSMCFVLVKKSPLTAADVARSRAFTEQYGFETLWAPPVGVDVRPPQTGFADYAALVHAIMTERDRARMFREAPFDISLATDDNPFYFVERARPGQRAGLGVLQLQTLVIALIVLIVPFLLVPLIPSLRRGREAERHWPSALAALVYFSLIGIAFMGVEIELFHVFALLLGSPIITFSVVLASLLLSSGAGSYASGRLTHASPLRLAAVFAALVGLLAVFLLTRGYLLSTVVAAPMAARAGATLLIVAPLGFLMGMPMPLGMELVARSERLVLWGWSLNGVFSVLASVGAIYSAIYIGTTRTFAIAAAAYVLAGAMLQIVRRRPTTAGMV